MVNVNPETGIRYGIISANSLNDEIIDEIFREGTDIHLEEAIKQLEQNIYNACRDFLYEKDIQAVVDKACSKLVDNNWYDDTPEHEFVIDGVRGQTTWLGGALMVQVFESPFITKARLCSPCVPNCGDLDSLDEEGEECYDVPPDWRIK